MAKNINHIQHVKSNVVISGAPKLPDASAIVEGEIAINYASGYETISLKNSESEIVTFSSDKYYTEKKLGSGFTGENSGKTVTEVIDENEQVTSAALNDLEDRKLEESDLDAYGAEIIGIMNEKLGSGFTGENSGKSVTDYIDDIEDQELVIAASLNDLNSRKLDASAYTPTDLSNYYTKDEIDSELGDYVTKTEYEEKLGSGFTGENSANTITKVIVDNERVTAAALNDLNTRINQLSGSSEGSISAIQESISSLQAENDAIRDDVGTISGNLDTVISDLETVSGNVNTISGDLQTLITTVEDDELVVSSSLNDLNSRINELSGNSSGDITNIQSSITEINNDILDITGDITALSGDVLSISADTEELSGKVESNELVTAAALNDLNSRIVALSGNSTGSISSLTESVDNLTTNLQDNYYTKTGTDNAIESATEGFFDGAEYNSTDKKIYFKHSGTTKAEIDATDFIKDGMVSSAYTSAVTEGDVTTDYIVIEFNTEAEKDSVMIPVSEVFDQNQYYTKDDIDDVELVIASSLNDLNSRLITVSGDVSDLQESAVSLDSSVTSASTNGVTSQGIYNAIEAAKPTLEDELSFSGSSASTNAVEAQAIIKLLSDKELVIAAALNDLNSRVNGVAYSADVATSQSEQDSRISEISGDVQTLSESVTALTSTVEGITPLSVFDDTVSASTRPVEAQVLYEAIVDNEQVTSSAMNDLNTRLNALSGRLDAMQSSIDTINTTLTSFETRIAALEA